MVNADNFFSVRKSLGNLAQFFKVTKVTFMTVEVQNSVDYSMNIA